MSTKNYRVSARSFIKDRSPLLITAFDGDIGTEWTAGGTGSVTPEVSTLYTRVGAQTIRIQVPAADAGGKRIDRSDFSLDLREMSHFYLATFVRTLGVVRISAAWTLIFCSDASGFTNYYTVNIDSNRHGYGVNVISRADFTSAGNPDWADIKQIRLTVNKKTEDQDVYFDGLYAGGWVGQASVVFTFDDGWDSQIDAFTELAAANIPCSYFLIGDLIDGVSYLTQSEVNQIAASTLSHIGLHGEDRWDTAANPATAIAADKAALRALVPSADLRFAAWPVGEFGFALDNVAECISAAQANGIVVGRATGRALYSVAIGNGEDRMYVNAAILSDSLDLAAAKALVDLAVTSRSTVVFAGHKLGAVADSLTWVTTDFTALIAHIVSKRTAGLLVTENFLELAERLGFVS